MKCSICNTEFNGTFCPSCGVKNSKDVPPPPHPLPPQGKRKKPFYFRWWFILIVVIAFLFIFDPFGEKPEKIDWDDFELGEMLPTPPAKKGEISSNSSQELDVEFIKVSQKQYNNYLKECKKEGFTIDAEETSYSYEAFNKEGFRLNLRYSDNREELNVSLNEPLDLATIVWPTNTASKLLPTPKSTLGKITYEKDDAISAYIGNTTKEDYAEYVNACSEKGFNVDYTKEDTYYSADNVNGWHVYIKYEGFNTMYISIDAPSEESQDEYTDENEEYVDVNEKYAGEDGSEKDETTNEPTASSNDLDPNFKKAMDSYEIFMNEYVSFMKKYMANPSDLSLLSDYADYMSKYADFVADFEKWESENLNSAETAYYIKVQSRVAKKLLEVAQ